jgi:hypothetical protein
VTVELALLPSIEIPEGVELYRIHRRANCPWYFDDSGRGRFDPESVPGRGACYWAEDELGAWIEVFRTRMTLTDVDLASYSISCVTLSRPLLTIDLTQRLALQAGVTAAFTAGSDYGPAHDLANELQGTSFQAVRWRLRHDLAQALIGLALFGPVGSHPDCALIGMPQPSESSISDDLIARAKADFGYEVLEEPMRRP